MTFTSWLKRIYPELSKNSAESYTLIKRAKSNKKPLIVASFILVYLIAFYTASILSRYFGAEFANGTLGITIYIISFVLGSVLFLSIRNFLVKREIEKLLKE